MKKDIHPTYYPKAKVTCACGNAFTVGSTMKEIKVELCSACHPFYTGKQKLVDSARRVEKFKEKMEKKVAMAKVKKEKKPRVKKTK
jgi:large subunit ribosomal protein L31